MPRTCYSSNVDPLHGITTSTSASPKPANGPPPPPPLQSQLQRQRQRQRKLEPHPRALNAAVLRMPRPSYSTAAAESLGSCHPCCCVPTGRSTRGSPNLLRTTQKTGLIRSSVYTHIIIDMNQWENTEYITLCNLEDKGNESIPTSEQKRNGDQQPPGQRGRGTGATTAKT